jgi:hypothetical protein
LNLWFIPGLILLGLAPIAPSKDFSAETQWKLLGSTLRILDSKRDPVATGVIVGRKWNLQEGPVKTYYVLTAFHIFREAPNRIVLLAQWFPRKIFPIARFEYFQCYIRVKDESADLALLEFKSTEDLPVAKLAKFEDYDVRADRERYPVLSIGCSLGKSPSCVADETLGKKLVMKSRSKENPENYPVAFFWEARKTSVKGRSGGPLFDSSERLIGISSAVQGGKSYYSHLDEINSFLKKNDFGWLLEK